MIRTLRSTAALLGLAVAAPACGGVETWPGISTGVLAAASLSGGVFALSDGHVLEGLGLTALGVGLGVVAFTMMDEMVAEAPSLRRREVALALAQGRGGLVTDLAADLGLPAMELSALGATLRKARARLLAAMPEPGDTNWRPFFVALRAVLAEDALLSPQLALLDERVRASRMSR